MPIIVTHAQLLDVAARFLPASYLDPILAAGDGYELIEGFAEQIARFGIAIARFDDDSFILTAKGPALATGTVQFYRQNPGAGEVTVLANTLVRARKGGQVFRTTEDAVFQSDDLLPTVLEDTTITDPIDWHPVANASPTERRGARSVRDPDRSVVVMFGGALFSDTWEFDGARWREIVPTTSPSAREEMALGYDTVRRLVVMFGGAPSGTYTNETLTYDGTTWALVVPASSPTARAYLAGAFDTVRGKFVIHGGYNGATMTGTSEWDGSNWAVNVAAGTSPSARAAHAMCFDEAHGLMVMFGGGTTGADASAVDETHTFDGTTWTLHAPTHKPSARRFVQLAYDPIRQVVVLHGGTDAAGVVLADTWEWDGNDWTQIDAAGGPARRATAPFSTSADGLGVTLFGGTDRITDRGTTWNRLGIVWREVIANIPSARYGNYFAQHTTRNSLVTFGGLKVPGNVIDDATWAWVKNADRTLSRWQLVGSAQAAPSERYGMATCWDETRSKFVCAGGANIVFTGISTVQEWDGLKWAAGVAMPAIRLWAASCYDPIRGVMVVFGGDIGGGISSATLTYDGTTWVTKAPTHHPSARLYARMAFDAVRGKVVMFGGQVTYGSTILSDTWEWDGTDWTQITTATTPPARHGMLTVWDSVRGVILMHGGDDGSYPPSRHDTWAYDGTDWELVSSAGPAYGHKPAVFDPVRGVLIMTDGINGVWEWDGAAWTFYATTVYPTGPFGAGCCWDAVRGEMVVFAGYDGAVINTMHAWDHVAGNWFKRSLGASPVGRYLGAIAFDGAETILFSGFDPLTGLSAPGTYGWNGSAWALKTTAHAPSLRHFAAMTYDSARGKIVLFGGKNDSATAPAFAVNNDTWEWDRLTQDWTHITTATSPTARASNAIAFDSTRGRVMMFGGNDNSTHNHELWEYYDDGGGMNWHLVTTTTTAPSSRSYSGLTYDSALARLVLFGGGNGISATLDDTWEFYDGDWHTYLPVTTPIGRAQFAFAFDGAEIQMFGGAVPSDQFSFHDATHGGTIWVPVETAIQAIGYGYEWNVDGEFTDKGITAPGAIDFIDLPLQDPPFGDPSIRVRNTAPTTGGRPGTLDAHGAERDLPRSPGELDPSYQERIRTLADTVSPAAIMRQVERYLVASGLEWRFVETWEHRYQECFDAPTGTDPLEDYDPNLFCFDDPGPASPIRNRWLSYSDNVGSFIVEVQHPPVIEEHGFCFDDPATGPDDLVSNLGQRAVSAYDVTNLAAPAIYPVFDGTDYGIDDFLFGLYDILQKIKAGGVLAVLHVQEI